MGNTSSNARTPNLPRTDHTTPGSIRTGSSSPTPGNPHRSLRTKKKSLELPDLASLAITQSNAAHNSRGRQTKTASIPIPVLPQGPFNHYRESQAVGTPQKTTRHLPSTSDVLLQQHHQEPSAHQPYPPPSRGSGNVSAAPRGRQQPLNPRQQAQVTRIQELYDNSHHPAAPPSSPASNPRPLFVPEVVQSSIPIALGKTAQLVAEEGTVPMQEDLLADPVPVRIVWKGGGKEVVLARAGDDEWKGRQPMERESPETNVWSLTVYLRPGTHHVRFLVDNQWRVADDLPAAVDDQGSLANYVAVPLTYGLAAQQAPRKLIPGQSFWSADSSADGDDSSSKPSIHSTPDPSTSAKHHHHHQNQAAVAYTQAHWTNVLPLELIEAAREEEAYLAASAGQYESATASTRVTGFVPAPNIPPAPGLPRHLDKLILNSRVGERTGAQDRAGGTPSGSQSGHGSGAVPPAQGTVLGGIGSGQGQVGRRERRDKERERERERDRDERRERSTRSRRANIPPPPPPSEDGTGDLNARPESSTAAFVPMNQNKGSFETTGTNGTPTSGAESGGPSTTTTAATSPQVSLPVTPTAPLSPTHSPSQVTWAGPLPNPPPTISGSRTITIDTASMPALTDDGSVLPVPSHVVLHHLCTSAIKNGVLAVANTTRYRKKYLTTIYYKPT